MDPKSVYQGEQKAPIELSRADARVQCCRSAKASCLHDSSIRNMWDMMSGKTNLNVTTYGLNAPVDGLPGSDPLALYPGVGNGSGSGRIGGRIPGR